MHQTRAQANKKMPLPRKGTKYIARSKVDLENSVPVVVAVRDMLKLARTSKEVKKMINQKTLKINGSEVKDYRDSIRLFNLFEAGKNYVLNFSNQGKFIFEETKNKERLCKVIGKKILRKNNLQINLHDGTNVITKDSKIRVNDTIYLDEKNNIKKHLPIEKGKDCFIIKGKFLGHKAKIENVEESRVLIKIKGLDLETKLKKEGVVVL